MSEQATPQRPFFVYGTLLPGQPNAYLWGDAAISLETAVFPSGRLYDMGYYPMLIEKAGETVMGMLHHIKPGTYADVLARLDELEGYDPQNPKTSAYQRVLQLVQLGNGRSVMAWLYLGNPQFVTGMPIIPTGDWRSYATKRRLTMTDWWENVYTVRDLHIREDL